MSDGERLMQKQAPSIGRILSRSASRCRASACAVPLDRLRRPDPAEGEELPVHRLFPEAVDAGDRVRCADRRRLGRQGEGLELAPPRAVNGTTRPGRDRDRAGVRADLRDARAILRQKTLLGETYVELTLGHRAGDEARAVSLGAAAKSSDAEAASRRGDPGGRHLGTRQTRTDPDRRDLQRPRRRDARRRSSAGRRTPPSRSGTAASTSTTRSATSGRSSPTPPTCSRSCAARRRRCRASSATPARSSRR